MYVKNNAKGVTLVELILSVALILIVLQVIYSIFFLGSDSLAVSTNKGFSQQGVRNTNIFLESELKYANNFYSAQQVSEGIPNTVFYGLKYEDGYLVLSKYSIIKDSTPTAYSINEVRRFKSESDKVLINNTTMGLITISLQQSESSGRKTSNFDLEHHIYLDDGSLLSSSIWDLSNVCDIMYFSKNQDAITGGILLNSTSDGNQNENNTNPKPKIITIASPIVKRNNGENIQLINNKYSLGHNNKYEIHLNYEYNGDQTLQIIASSTTELNVKNDHDLSTKTIVIKGTSPKSSEDAITITITLTASDAHSVTRTITIGS